MTAFAKRIPAEHVELSRLRQDASSWLVEGLGGGQGETVCDVSVVLTELVANAIDHTESVSVDVRLALNDGFVTIEVANDGPVSVVPPVEHWGELTEGARGRGLRLIRALCGQVDVTGDADRTRIACRYLTG